MTKATIVAAMALLVWLAPVSRANAQPDCAGDCDGGGAVTVNEIIVGVNRVLGLSDTECAALDGNDDGEIVISELIAAVNSLLDGCGGEPATRENVVANYAAMLFANYSDAVTLAEDLRDAVDAFVADPSQERLDAAKQAWLDSRPTYLQTEMARFYDGPIDNEETGPEGLINAWPLDESFIDYVDGAADSGVVNMTEEYPEITAGVLAALNESISETSIFTGYHAIEFLLWGQDQSDTGPGARPFTDYVTDGSGTAANQQRRGAYLVAVAELLVENLEQVRDQWAPGVAGNYRAAFLAEEPDEALRRILTGMGTLSGGELTGERLSVAFDTKDQEDEHSCFSDNTHIDHLFDAAGIENAFLGRYNSVLGNSVSGPSIYDLVLAEDAGVANETRDAFSAARQAIDAIPQPFDQAIQGADDAPGRLAIQAAIDALNVQTDQIAISADELGISISTTLP